MNDMPENDRRRHPDPLPEGEGEMERLQRMLEDVTTADRSHPLPKGEGEDAGLRDAWLAFGRLLDAADEAQSGNWNPASIQPVEPRKKEAEKRNRHFGPIVAAAAALIIALGVTLWLNRDIRPNGGGGPAVVGDKPKDIQPRQVVQQPNVPAPNEQAPLVANNDATKPKQDSSAAKSSTWDDPIETQIASVSQQIDSVRQTWQHRTDDVDLVQYRIDDVSAGLSKDEL
jgi:hypothetical protein